MSKQASIMIVGLFVLLLVGVGWYSYNHSTVTVLSEEKVENRCSEHKSADACAADRLCQGVETTPVCFANGVCAPGGYVCVSKS